MRPNCGSACSERYSSSPLTRTTRLPFPGPFFPGRIRRSSAAIAANASRHKIQTARVNLPSPSLSLLRGSLLPDVLDHGCNDRFINRMLELQVHSSPDEVFLQH